MVPRVARSSRVYHPIFFAKLQPQPAAVSFFIVLKPVKMRIEMHVLRSGRIFLSNKAPILPPPKNSV